MGQSFQIRILKLLAVGILAIGLWGCDSEVPTTEEALCEYPQVILYSDTAKVIVPNEGDNPIAIFGVHRRASDQLESFECRVNDVEISTERIEEMLSRVWDSDDILPEGVEDTFSITILERGKIEVNICANYKSGMNYSAAVAFEYTD